MRFVKCILCNKSAEYIVNGSSYCEDHFRKYVKITGEIRG